VFLRLLITTVSTLLTHHSLLEINKRNTYTNPDDVPYDDPQRVKKLSNQDEDIFQTARVINCSWFGSAIFSDYFSSILGPLHTRLFPDQVHANTSGGFMPYTNSFDPDAHSASPSIANGTTLILLWHTRFVCSVSTRTAFNCNSMGFMVSMGFDPIRKYQFISNVVPVL